MKKLLFTLLAGLLLAGSASAKKTKIKIETTEGTITVLLYNSTPLNSKNMVKQAKAHAYDSTLFHRCIPKFVIQGGDPESKQAKPGQRLGNGGLKYTVPAEINDHDFHKRGALGVARDQNPDKSGSACQFYIVSGKPYTDAELDNISKNGGRKFTDEQRTAYKTIGGTAFLDGGYTVFGEVTKGMDIVDKIANEPRDANDRPNRDIRMLKVRVKKRFLLF